MASSAVPYAVGAFALVGALFLLGGEDTTEPVETDDDPEPPDPTPDEKKKQQQKKKESGKGYVAPTEAEWVSFRTALLAAGVTNFTAEELTSWGGGKYGIPKGDKLVNFLKIIRHAQAIRKRYGKPLLISSGYRPWDKAGGNHEQGTAIDFDLPSRTKANEHEFRLVVAQYWKETPTLMGLGFYHSPTGRVHVDVNQRKGRRRWYMDEISPIFSELQQA